MEIIRELLPGRGLRIQLAAGRAHGELHFVLYRLPDLVLTLPWGGAYHCWFRPVKPLDSLQKEGYERVGQEARESAHRLSYHPARHSSGRLVSTARPGGDEPCMRSVLIFHEEADLDREVMTRWLASFTELVGLVVIREERKGALTSTTRITKRI